MLVKCFLSVSNLIIKKRYIMGNSDIGVIGMGVMGANLALNFEEKGCTVSLYNRQTASAPSKVSLFMAEHGLGKRFNPTHSIAELVDSIRRPRKILLMIKAGVPVDDLIHQLIPFLSPDDIVIDGGNSDFRDTARRVLLLESKGFYYIGAGVSGGELGARYGASIMPGGSFEAWPQVQDILQAASAKLTDGSPCCEWMGIGGAGHFVKMVHNGIEYAFMQLITEAVMLLKRIEPCTNDALSCIFSQWNEGALKSYLIKITAQIFAKKEQEGGDSFYLLDKVLDVARQKGTGHWCVEAGLALNEPLPIMAQALYARYLSVQKELRLMMSGRYPTANTIDSAQLNLTVQDVQQSLYASVLMAYAEGFSLINRASIHYGWQLPLDKIALIWQEGCIIRADFLKEITAELAGEPKCDSLLLTPFYHQTITANLPAWHNVIAEAAVNGVALPCMAAALNQFNSLRLHNSMANLIQAQRDYFGAHTYQRVDAPRDKSFHSDWEGGDQC